MDLYVLDTETANLNLTTLVAVLTDTPSTKGARICQATIHLGDGTNNLTATGGVFEVVIEVGGQTVQPSPHRVAFGTEVRSSIITPPFLVPTNQQVLIKVLSPNAGDTVVAVTATLVDTTGPNTFVRGNATGTPTTTSIVGDAGLSATDAAYTSAFLVFESGALAGISRKIIGYTGSTKTLDFTGDAWPAAPSANDEFVIIGRSK